MTRSLIGRAINYPGAVSEGQLQGEASQDPCVSRYITFLDILHRWKGFTGMQNAVVG